MAVVPRLDRKVGNVGSGLRVGKGGRLDGKVVGNGANVVVMGGTVVVVSIGARVVELGNTTVAGGNVSPGGTVM